MRAEDVSTLRPGQKLFARGLDMRCTKTVETCYFKEVKDAKRIVVFDKKPVVGKPLPMMMLMFVTDAFLTLEDLNRSPA